MVHSTLSHQTNKCEQITKHAKHDANSMASIVIIIFRENQVDLKFENQKKINKCMGL